MFSHSTEYRNVTDRQTASQTALQNGMGHAYAQHASCRNKSSIITKWRYVSAHIQDIVIPVFSCDSIGQFSAASITDTRCRIYNKTLSNIFYS